MFSISSGSEAEVQMGSVVSTLVEKSPSTELAAELAAPATLDAAPNQRRFFDGLSLQVLRARFSSREAAPASEPRWALPELCGRLVELCGSGAPFSLAMALVRDAQARGEPAAWVTSQERSFYPPDAQACGVDLAALPVIRVPAEATARAADALLRSGAFGLAVVDLGALPLPAPLQSRLLSLARLHQSAVVFLTEGPADASSLGPLISLRAEAVRTRIATGFSCALRVLKDKQRPPSWTHVEVCRGPPGLR